MKINLRNMYLHNIFNGVAKKRLKTRQEKIMCTNTRGKVKKHNYIIFNVLRFFVPIVTEELRYGVVAKISDTKISIKLL